MRIKFFITSIFSIVLFAGIASAQQGRIYLATNVGVYVPLTPVSATSGPVSGPNISSFAGQTIRIRIVAADASTATLMWGIPSSPSECDVSTPFMLTTGTYGRGTFSIRLETNELLAATDPSWKGTCRILDVRLGDGSRHIGRILFQ